MNPAAAIVLFWMERLIKTNAYQEFKKHEPKISIRHK
jgi:hypothetical protein